MLHQSLVIGAIFFFYKINKLLKRLARNQRIPNNGMHYLLDPTSLKDYNYKISENIIHFLKRLYPDATSISLIRF